MGGDGLQNTPKPGEVSDEQSISKGDNTSIVKRALNEGGGISVKPGPMDTQYSFDFNSGDRFTGEGITEEPNLVYEDHDGIWVTDLAFSQPLKLMANSVLEGEESVSLTDLIPGLQENEFKPASECLKMLEAEEECYNEEEEVTEEELKNLAKMNGMPQEGWLVTDRLETEEEENNFHKRISIGTFLSLRSEDMGFLEGRLALSRPVIFAHKVESPPTDRKPRALCRRPSDRGYLDESHPACNETLSASDLVSSGQFKTPKLLDQPQMSDAFRNAEDSYQPISTLTLKQLQESNDSLKSLNDKFAFSEQSAFSSIPMCGSAKGQFVQSTELTFDKKDYETMKSSKSSSDEDVQNPFTDSRIEPVASFCEPSSFLDMSKFVEKMNKASQGDSSNLSELILRCSNAKWKEDIRVIHTIGRDSLYPLNELLIESNQVFKNLEDVQYLKYDANKLDKSNDVVGPNSCGNQGFKVPEVPKISTNRKKLAGDDFNLKNLTVPEITQSLQNVHDVSCQSSAHGRMSSASINNESRIPSMYFKAGEEESFNRLSESESNTNKSLYSPTMTRQSRSNIRPHLARSSKKEVDATSVGSKSTFRKLDMSKLSFGQSIERESLLRSHQSGSTGSSSSSQAPFAGARPKNRKIDSEDIVTSLIDANLIPPMPVHHPRGQSIKLPNFVLPEMNASTDNEDRLALKSLTSSKFHPSVSSSTDVMIPLRSINETLDMTLDVQSAFQNFGLRSNRGWESRPISALTSCDSSPSRSSTRSSAPKMATSKDLKLKPIIVESAYNMPEVCCVGLIRETRIVMKNPNPISVQVETSVSDIKVDGMLCGPAVIQVKEKFRLQANECKSLKVTFAPIVAGVHKCELGLDVISPGNGNVCSFCLFSAISEHPQVEITCVGSSAQITELDFEAVPWGSYKTITILIKNKGKSLVPVHLFTSSLSKENHFWFAAFLGDQTDADVRVSHSVTAKLHPAQDVPLSPDSQLRDISDTLIDAEPSNEKKVMLLFRAPEGEYPLTTSISMAGWLKVEVHKSSMHLPVACVPLLAEVGSIKLRVNKEVICVKNNQGESNPSEMLALTNSGSIIANIHLEMKTKLSLFSVHPSHVMVEPNGRVEVTIAFNAAGLQKGMRLEDRLTLKMRPSGLSFEMLVSGEVVQDPLRTRMALMTTHWTVFWSAAQAKVSRGIQTVTLCNRGDHMLRICLEVRGAMQFKLIASSERRIETTRSRIIVIKPGSDFKVGLQFEAQEPRFYSAKLMLFDTDGPSKFKIPMFGYEGESSLVLHSADLGPMGQYIAAAEEVDDLFFAEVVLVNEGRRTCFVKAVMFKDKEGNQAVTDTSASVSPNSFCIRENGSQKVVITMPRSDPLDSFVGLVKFHYGDEINRQLHGRFLGRSSNIIGVDFSGEFANEEPLTVEEKQESEGLANGDQFFSSINKVSLILIDQGHSSNMTLDDIATEPDNARNSSPSGRLMQRNSTSSISSQLQQQSPHPQPNSGGINSLLTAIQSVIPADLLHSLQDVRITPEDRQQMIQTLTRNCTPEQHRSLNIPPSNMGFNSPPIRGPHSQVCAQHHTVSSNASLTRANLTSGKKSWTLKPRCLDLDPDNPERRNFLIINCSNETMNFRIEMVPEFLSFSVLFGDIPPGSEMKIVVLCHPHIKSMGVALPWSGNVQVIKTTGIPGEKYVKVVTINIAPGEDKDECDQSILDVRCL